MFQRFLMVCAAGLMAASCAPAKAAGPVRAPVREPSPAYTTSGIVLDVQRGTPNAPATYVHLIVQPSRGAPVRVDLGPGWLLDEHGLRFSKDDVVEVEGRAERRGEEEVFVAHRLRMNGEILEIRKAGTPAASQSLP
jgi:hypothetical protein